MRDYFPMVIPSNMTDDVAAQILGILNTNYLELDQMNGSGVFVLSRMVEPSCTPNCSFTTSGINFDTTSYKISFDFIYF